MSSGDCHGIELKRPKTAFKKQQGTNNSLVRALLPLTPIISATLLSGGKTRLVVRFVAAPGRPSVLDYGTGPDGQIELRDILHVSGGVITLFAVFRQIQPGRFDFRCRP